MRYWKIMLCLAAVTMIAEHAAAQQERKFVRRGNRDYKNEKFNDAEINYMRALQKDSTSTAAMYNLSSALYRLERFDDALALQNTVAADSVQNAVRVSDLRFNTGNSYFQKKEYAKAIEQYKQSLRENPDDYEAKFNLAYAQLMQQNQEQQEQQNQNDQNDGGGQNDQNKDQNQNPDQNEDKDQQDDGNDDRNQDDKNDGNPDKQDGNPEDRDGGQQPQDGQMTKQEAEQYLKAIQNNEDKTQEKIKEQKAKGAVVKGKKNW